MSSTEESGIQTLYDFAPSHREALRSAGCDGA